MSEDAVDEGQSFLAPRDHYGGRENDDCEYYWRQPHTPPASDKRHRSHHMTGHNPLSRYRLHYISFWLGALWYIAWGILLFSKRPWMLRDSNNRARGTSAEGNPIITSPCLFLWSSSNTPILFIAT
jgi:hypothetical protein